MPAPTSKNINNSPFLYPCDGAFRNLNVTGTATFDGPVEVDGDINATGDINAGGYLSTLGGPPFSYSYGTWVPELKTIRRGDGGNPPFMESFINGNYLWQEGYYIKTGRNVQVWFNARVDFPGPGNAYTEHVKLPCVTNLPFKCLLAEFSQDLIYNQNASLTEWPNGFIDNIPGILTNTFEYPYQMTLYEEGYSVPMYNVTAVGDVVYDHWTADGYTMIPYCKISFYYAAVSIPPSFPLLYSGWGPVNNQNVILTGNYNYTVNGIMSYITDDP